MSSSIIRNRLNKEMNELRRNPDADISLEPDENQFDIWHGSVIGPQDTPYAKGKFHVRLQIPATYPMAAPKVWFKTKIFHPNVHFGTGELCLDVLKTDWSPMWGLAAILRAIVALLVTPNADSPLNCDAGNLIRCGDMIGFDSMARMYTVEHAIKNRDVLYDLLKRYNLKRYNRIWDLSCMMSMIGSQSVPLSAIQ
ncbi:unnamed protein product [Amoebophrya sp. A120]|nr:unnamed protein product [Amoebophrya sp. A120]|eukprot:GSA120T00017868001.1